MALTQINTDGVKDDAVTAGKIPANAVGSSEIADDAVGLAQMAAGTDGQVITYDASGNPVAVGPGTDGQVLTSTGAGSPPAFENAAASVGGASGADFNDDVKLRFGTGNDLEIYHSGTHSYIKDAGTGHLTLIGSRVEMNNAANDETMLKAEEDGAVTLYHNNSTKFETTSYGNHFNGNLRCDDASYIQCGSSQDLLIGHNGTNSFLNNSTGELQIQANDVRFYTDGASETHAKFINNGAVQLFYDNSEKIKTTNTGIEVTGNVKVTSGNGIDFHNYGSGTNVNSNLLDDYEEGLWTPDMTGTSGSATVTHSTRKGWYTKVGKLVNLWYYANWSGGAGYSGTLQLGGFPFTVVTGTGWELQVAGPIMMNQVNIPDDTKNMVMHTWNGVTYGHFYITKDAAGWTSTGWSDSGAVIGSISYMSA